MLFIVSKNPDISGCGIVRLCRKLDYVIGEWRVNTLVSKLIDEDLLVRDSKYNLHYYPIKITNLGISRLLSYRCLIRQLVP